MQVEQRVVVADHVAWSGQSDAEHGKQEDADRQELLAQCRSHPPLAHAEQEHGEEEDDRKHDELRPREGGQRREGDQGQLRALARLCEGDRRRRDRGEHQRVSERLGGDERRVEQVWNEQGERGEGERDAA
jgi:hypothetical protein